MSQLQPENECPICGLHDGNHKMSCRVEYRRCVDADKTYIVCEGQVTYGPDPFAEEIYGDKTPVWMCESHRYESFMDI